MTVLKTVYALRVRPDDKAKWGEPDYYRTRIARDRDASMARVWAGLRTHSYEERKDPETIDFLREY